MGRRCLVTRRKEAALARRVRDRVIQLLLAAQVVLHLELLEPRELHIQALLLQPQDHRCLLSIRLRLQLGLILLLAERGTLRRSLLLQQLCVACSFSPVKCDRFSFQRRSLFGGDKAISTHGWYRCQLRTQRILID